MSDPVDKQRNARRAAALGVMVFAISAAVLFLPLLIPTYGYGKYLVVTAFIGAMAGLGMLLNGAIDLWRGK